MPANQSAEAGPLGAPTILVVDDEQLVRWSLRQSLEERGYFVREAGDAAAARREAALPVDLVLLDIRLPDGDGLDLLRAFQDGMPDVPVILMTAHSNIETAVEAIKKGAYHYVRKPFEVDEILIHVGKALETTALRRELRALRSGQPGAQGAVGMVGESPAMRRLKDLLAKVAASPASTVLLTGESGTGKDLAARAIHHQSDRVGRPFVNITCSALPENLLESELFGHERGAFTDAHASRRGLLETAHGGTAFLDEIAEMSPGLQAKLLRFLEEKAFRRVGGHADLKVDVRVIAATHRDLNEAVRTGDFRDDLYYRLAVLPVHVPPLRDRQGDVPLLVQHFIDKLAREFGRPVRGVTRSGLRYLESYGWPGNVRELRNAVERAMLLATGDLLDEADFTSFDGGQAVAQQFRLPPGGLDFESLERDLVQQALERTGGNQTRAASLLGMNRDQIRYRIEKFGLPRRPGAD